MIPDPSNKALLADIGVTAQRERALRLASEQQQQTTTVQNVSLCIQIAANRDKLCGEHGSAKSASIVDAADRILLKWINGLTGESVDAG